MQHKIIDRRYKIVTKLGVGATGTVYKVRDLKDTKILALKILSKKTVSSETVQHFKREFTLLAGLRHPHLCSVYDFGILQDGRNYFTMEYIDGENIFRASRHNTYRDLYPWIVQLCRVLEYIHAKGLIHYDIKPSNVLIQKSKNGTCVKLMDFGLAGEERLGSGALIKGTFPYIAPELVRSSTIDHRVDLYSLGVLLYEIFTRRSFRRGKKTFTSVLKQKKDRITERPSNIVRDIPKRLETLILRLLEYKPSQRYGRANEVINEINKITGFKFESETEKTLEGYVLSSQFVGRDREIQLLQTLYKQAQLGNGKVVLITGDVGIGKTRLLKEFKVLTQLKRSHCLIGYAHREKTKPLEPFYDIFKELIHYIDNNVSLKIPFAVLFKLYPDLIDGRLKKNLPKLVPLEPNQEKLRNFEALYELITYCAMRFGALIILLEDMHWADDLSTQFLEYLGYNIANTNIFICATFREEESKRYPHIKKMIASSNNENCFTHIGLYPLKFKKLYSFLDSIITPESNCTELVKYLMEKTGGNPFFVEEIMRTLLHTKNVIIGERIDIEDIKKLSIPERIEDVFLKRIKELDQTCTSVITFGAILLKGFSYDMIQRLTDFGDIELTKALWELKRRRILIEEDDRFKFYHATLRDTINRQLSKQEKINLNFRVGNTIASINRKKLDPVIEDLAYHYIQARDKKRGVVFGLQAAKKCSAMFANEQAIQFYQDVYELLVGKNKKQRVDILYALARVEVLADRYDDALSHYTKALRLKVGAIDKRIKIYLGIGDMYAKKGEQNEALRIYQRAATLLKKIKSSKFRILLAANINVKLCKAYIILGDYGHVEKFSFDNLRILKKRLKDRETVTFLIDIYNNMGATEIHKGIRSMIDYNKAIHCYKEAYKYSREIKADDKIAGALSNLAICYYYKYDYQKAFDCYEKAIQISEKVGDQYSVSSKLLNLGTILKESGQYSKAIESFQKVLSIAEKIGNPSITGGALLRLGACFLDRCEYTKARDNYLKALKIFDAIDWKGEKGYLIRSIGIINQLKGDYTSALKYYRKALKIFRDIRHQRKIADIYINISSALVAIGQFSKASKYIENSLKITTALGMKDIEIDSYRILCCINLIKKNYSRAQIHFEKNMKMAKQLGTKIQLLQSYLLLSEIYYHKNEYTKGSKLASKSMQLAEMMGTKDLYAEALLLKARCGKYGNLTKNEVFEILKEAMQIVEEIDCPEILWKIYFEIGRNFQDDKEYHKAIRYYQLCNEIFEVVGGRFKKETYKISYLNHPERKQIFTSTNEIERALN
jgi:serine/threonine protein kinase/tetratricopeptide (TPR) repeat protein